MEAWNAIVGADNERCLTHRACKSVDTPIQGTTSNKTYPQRQKMLDQKLRERAKSLSVKKTSQFPTLQVTHRFSYP
jgi:hypothetical protein